MMRAAQVHSNLNKYERLCKPPTCSTTEQQANAVAAVAVHIQSMLVTD